ncbi:MAG: zinc metalloprotease, partial [Bacteroidota bacterium]|nr:zinc metalloprotease [Bacteroidota bacterium]
MKIFVLLIIASSLIFTSCSKDEMNVSDEATSANHPGNRHCATMEVLEKQLQEDPSLSARMNEIEAFTNFVQAQRLLPDGTIEIPVVVNVLYKTSAQNISLSQIQSQINVLNADFAATNADYNNTPSIFQNVRSGNIGITFVLDQVVRKATTKSSWNTNDAMKKSSQGGINPTSASTKLNMWVCNMGGGILGYAQFPGGSLSTDGVVVDDNAFGNTGTVTSPYHKGRTATHEVGHWMNLRHIWGDATCGSDQVSDTPTHNTANYGCPGYPHYSTCSGSPVEMTMNYMDYTYDICMYMFSAGQKTRMKAVFAPGGPRNSFA